MRETFYEISVNESGDLTLPQALRDALGLQVGDTLRVMETDNHFMLIPKRLMVPAFADYFSTLLEAKGLTVNDLLDSGESIRDALFAERYGDVDSE